MRVSTVSRSPRSPTRRRSASSPAATTSSSSPPTSKSRASKCPTPPANWSLLHGEVTRPPRRHLQLHRRPAQGPRRSPRLTRSTSSQIDPASHRVTVGADAELATTHSARQSPQLDQHSRADRAHAREDQDPPSPRACLGHARAVGPTAKSSPRSTSRSAPSRPASPPSSTTATK